jgi:HPt (histidine-containing phosphotransfer) domain-containing protein
VTRRLQAAWATRSGNDGAGTLEGDVGSDVYQDLLGSFLRQLPLQLTDLRDAAEITDVVAARYVAHQIKGVALNFGAVHLDELAERLLLIARDQGELLPSFVDEIDEEIRLLQVVLGPFATRK